MFPLLKLQTLKALFLQQIRFIDLINMSTTPSPQKYHTNHGLTQWWARILGVLGPLLLFSNIGQGTCSPFVCSPNSNNPPHINKANPGSQTWQSIFEIHGWKAPVCWVILLSSLLLLLTTLLLVTPGVGERFCSSYWVWPGLCSPLDSQSPEGSLFFSCPKPKSTWAGEHLKHPEGSCFKPSWFAEFRFTPMPPH